MSGDGVRLAPFQVQSQASHPMDEFGKSVEAQISHVRRYAHALTHNRLYADDLVQDCLVRALSKKDHWQEGTDLRAWLFTILHNEFINNLRRSASEGASVAISETEPSLACEPNQEQKLELRDLHRALGQLSAEKRAVILLVSLEDARYDAVAKILGVPTGTVGSRLYHGRKELRRLMGYEGPTGETTRRQDLRTDARTTRMAA
jgi:RNA polymerase sigma-70 factor, ECF subfamily